MPLQWGHHRAVFTRKPWIALLLFSSSARDHGAVALGVEEYVEGIDWIQAGDYAEAVKALDRAIAAEHFQKALAAGDAWPGLVEAALQR